MEQEAEQRQTEPNPRVIAIIGPRAAGKGELAHYLRQQYGVPAIEVGRFARVLAGSTAKNPTQLQYDTVAKDLAEFDSEYILTRLVTEIVENDQRWTNTLVITGVRTPAEAAALKAHFGPDILLAYVRVGDLKTRYLRMKERDFSTDPDSFKAFARQDEELKEDYFLAKTAALADIILWNDSSQENFYQQIEEYMVPHLFPKANEVPSPSQLNE